MTMYSILMLLLVRCIALGKDHNLHMDQVLPYPILIVKPSGHGHLVGNP